jgi:hypothetical protein
MMTGLLSREIRWTKHGQDGVKAERGSGATLHWKPSGNEHVNQTQMN